LLLLCLFYLRIASWIHGILSLSFANARKKHFLRGCAFFFSLALRILLCLSCCMFGGVSDFTRQILIFMLTVKHAEKI
jgi:hypothetical protein